MGEDVHPALWKSAAASCGGALLTSLMMTPLDVVKVQMQAQVCGSACAIACTLHPPSMVGRVRTILKSQGPRGLWRGLSVALILALPSTTIYYTLYDTLRDSCAFGPLLAGATARSVSSTATSPLELLRTRMQSGGTFGNLSAGQILRATDLRVSGVLRGLGPTLARDVPFSAIYWSLYENAKRSLWWWDSPTAKHLVSGSGAGMIAAAITTPADVLKTRRQAMASESLGTIIGDILQIDGWRGFFRGLWPRVAKVAPSCAIMMASFETIRTVL